MLWKMSIHELYMPELAASSTNKIIIACLLAKAAHFVHVALGYNAHHALLNLNHLVQIGGSRSNIPKNRC